MGVWELWKTLGGVAALEETRWEQVRPRPMQLMLLCVYVHNANLEEHMEIDRSQENTFKETRSRQVRPLEAAACVHTLQPLEEHKTVQSRKM